MFSRLSAPIGILTLGLVLVTACSDADVDVNAPENAVASSAALRAAIQAPVTSTIPRRPLSSHVGSVIIVSNDSGGDTGGGLGGVGTQCSDQSEGHQCTECTVNGETCECCGWTECWEEADACICAIEVDDVTCTRNAPGGSGGTGGGIETLPQ